MKGGCKVTNKTLLSGFNFLVNLVNSKLSGDGITSLILIYYTYKKNQACISGITGLFVILYINLGRKGEKKSFGQKIAILRKIIDFKMRVTSYVLF